jgi:hypothetical protein
VLRRASSESAAFPFGGKSSNFLDGLSARDYSKIKFKNYSSLSAGNRVLLASLVEEILFRMGI